MALANGRPPPAQDPAEVAARVGALIWRAGRPIPPRALAQALAMPVDEIEDGVGLLDAALRECGLRLRRAQHDGSLRITDDGRHPVAPKVIRALIRACEGRTGLDRRAARLLYRIMLGETSLRALTSSNSDRVTMARLISAGLVVEARDSASTLRLSEQVKDSLRLE
jgi:chromosome segregation and condensation protein ScpB